MPSFNVQNAKALSISEGDVKTIHESNGHLLWGAVGYSTKYAGDTEQQTYTGKNILPITPASPSGLTISYDTSTGELSVSGTPTTQYNDISVFTPVSIAAGTVVTASRYITTISGSAVRLTQIGLRDSTTDNSDDIDLVESEYRTITTSKAITRARIIVRLYANEAYNFKIKAQLEIGSVPTSYEPYVGGIPSPNPDYPQSISVVTGTQTVTLSDGTNTEDFTVSLGSEELCKIGDYQDYIYKSEGNWYKHAEIEKLVLDGTEGHNISSFHNQLSSVNGFRIALGTGKENVGAYQLLSGHFRYDQWSNYNSGSTRQYATISDTSSATNALYMSQVSDTIGAGNSSTSVVSMNTWFASNNIIIYYALATATDIQITDANLIAQLEAIDEWLTRYGYSATVSGSLPLVISQTELT